MSTPDEPTPSPFADYVAALGQLAEPPKAGRAEINAHRHYTYLTLPDLIEAIRPVFAAHRLAFMQDCVIHESRIVVTTRILHASGQTWESLPFSLPSGRTPQEIGSALTYARRYSLATFVGLAGADDDDAHAAQRPGQQPVPPPRSSDPGQQPATAKQKAALRRLAAAAGLDAGQSLEVIRSVTGHDHADQLDVRSASDLIKHLQTLADLAEQAAHDATQD